MSDANQRPRDETSLVDRVLSGDDEAWKTFCEIYSPLIDRSIRRYVKEPEAARDLYVSLLEKLRSGILRRYRGVSALATWLFVVARNHCRDYYRSESGLRHVRGMLEGMGEGERRLFELHYIEGLSMRDACESLRCESHGAVHFADVVRWDDAIRRAISKKRLGKLTERLLRPEAVRRGERSIESMPDGVELLDTTVASPEDRADAGPHEDALRALRGAIRELEPRDRLMLELRFEQVLSLRKIGEILDAGDARRVHEKLTLLIDRLRERLLERGLSAELAGELMDALGRSDSPAGTSYPAIFPRSEHDAE